MAYFIKGILLALFALVVFLRDSFPSTNLYWLAYVAMFALIPLWWFAEYWVPEKKAKKLIDDEIINSFFACMPPDDVRNDFTRGCFCITKEDIYLVSKVKLSYKIVWSLKRKNIESVGLGKVSLKKGFIIYTAANKEYSFASKHAEEIQRILLEI